ncbi:hypothetical protein WDW89_06200 [Deltaproteobacteria bacterium TL4]
MRSNRSVTFLLLGIVFGLSTCSKGREWKNAGDSCVSESGKPPMHRVVNYNDPSLCGRTPPPFSKVAVPIRNPCEPEPEK